MAKIEFRKISRAELSQIKMRKMLPERLLGIPASSVGAVEGFNTLGSAARQYSSSSSKFQLELWDDPNMDDIVDAWLRELATQERSLSPEWIQTWIYAYELCRLTRGGSIDAIDVARFSDKDLAEYQQDFHPKNWAYTNQFWMYRAGQIVSFIHRSLLAEIDSVRHGVIDLIKVDPVGYWLAEDLETLSNELPEEFSIQSFRFPPSKWARRDVWFPSDNELDSYTIGMHEPPYFLHG